jgi:hypothetical protein
MLHWHLLPDEPDVHRRLLLPLRVLLAPAFPPVARCDGLRNSPMAQQHVSMQHGHPSWELERARSINPQGQTSCSRLAMQGRGASGIEVGLARSLHVHGGDLTCAAAPTLAPLRPKGPHRGNRTSVQHERVARHHRGQGQAGEELLAGLVDCLGSEQPKEKSHWRCTTRNSALVHSSVNGATLMPG